MTTTRRSGIALVAAAALAITAAACGSDDDEAADNAASASESAADDDEASASASEPMEDDEAVSASASAPAADEAAASGPIEVTDATGNTVTLDAPPERIACLIRSCDGVLAETDVVPIASVAEPSLGSTLFYGDRFSEVVVPRDDLQDTEAIVAAEPDLIVILDSDFGRETAATLEGVAPIIFLAGEADTNPEVWAENARIMTTAIGQPEIGEAMVQRWDDLVAQLEEDGFPGADDVRFWFMFGGSPLDTYGGWFDNVAICEVVEGIGAGDCVVEPPPGAEGDYGEFSPEAILGDDPTHMGYLFRVTPEGEPREGFLTFEERTADPVWTQLTAVQNDDVFITPTSGMYADSYLEFLYELENYLFNVFGPDAGFENPGDITEWSPPPLP